MATIISGDTGVDKVSDGADMPVGSVLQVIPFVGYGSFNHLTTSTQKIPMTEHSITTTALNSHIIYLATLPYEIDGEPGNSFWRVARNGSPIDASSTNGNGDDNYTSQTTILYTDTPNVAQGTTLTYSVYMDKTNTGSINIGQDSLSGQTGGTTNNVVGYLMEVMT